MASDPTSAVGVLGWLQTVWTALGRLTLGELAPEHVDRMLAGLVVHDREGRPTTRPVSARTRQYVRAVLRSALNRAVKRRILTRNAAELADAPHVDRAPIVPLTLDAATRLLAVVRGEPPDALYSVALAIGLRQGEALGLRWSDVDVARAQVIVQVALEQVDGDWHLKDLKPHRCGKLIPLPRFAVDALTERLEIQREERRAAGFAWRGNTLGLVFTTGTGMPLSRHNLYRQWRGYLAAAKLPPARFYNLRHTCASLLRGQGVGLDAIRDILGRATIVLTADTYVHLGQAEHREAMGKMEELFPAAESRSAQ